MCYVNVILMTFDKQSNGRRIEVVTTALTFLPGWRLLRNDSVSGRHVRLSVKPRRTSANVPAGGAGVRRSTQLPARRGRTVVRSAHLRRRPVRLSERRLHPATMGLRPRQRLRRHVRRAGELQYGCLPLSVSISFFCVLLEAQPWLGG